MSLNLPFAKQPKFTPQSVGSEEHGTIYLSKRNGRTGRERDELDAVDEIETKLQLTLYKLIKKIATDKQISEDAALEIIFTEDTGSTALADYSDEIEKMMDLKNQAKKYRDLVVTVMIRERILYPVYVQTDAKKGEMRIEISELDFELPVNTSIKFDSQTVVTASVLSEGDSMLQLDSKLSEGLKVGSVGFLLQPNGKVAVGNPEWDIVATSSVNDPLQDMIFEFYQSELLGKSEGKGQKKEPLKKPSGFSKISLKEEVSTGSNSTIESKDIPEQTVTSEVSGIV